ncbi:MAG: response regulator [Treponema sp.]|jgi:DNA-binding NtrC family response regulator|nr:response regulator [Treponema sp.]
MKKKIIHVDNSSFFRKLMRIFLVNEGFEVESFDNWEDAAIAVSGGSADMVITGLALADMSGETYIKKMVDSYAGPIIVMSSSINQQTEHTMLALGVKAAIGKSGGWKEALRPYLVCLR